MYYIPIILTVFANVLYHIAQKYTSEKVNPMLSLMITYGVALIVCIVVFIFTKDRGSLTVEMKSVNWASILLGFAIVLLELGFLLAYRKGWNISTAAIISTILVTMFLLPIGRFMFQEEISGKNLVGIAVSIVGIIMMNGD